MVLASAHANADATSAPCREGRTFAASSSPSALEVSARESAGSTKLTQQRSLSAACSAGEAPTLGLRPQQLPDEHTGRETLLERARARAPPRKLVLARRTCVPRRAAAFPNAFLQV